MVATTFSSDTPNLVTDIVRRNGVAGNWVWWAFTLTGVATVFFYARLWRRSGVLTDLEFYELRYSGKAAGVVRGFRSVYLGFFFNCIIMATVNLAACKIAAVLFGIDRWQTLLFVGLLNVVFAAVSGLWGVLVIDMIQFFIKMTAVIAAAYFAVKAVGGLPVLISTLTATPGPGGINYLNILPDFKNHWDIALAVFIMPIAVQWWAVWYPGAEPGGGSYIAQRMLASKSEKDSLGSVLFFNIAHYVLRPWPWILVAPVLDHRLSGARRHPEGLPRSRSAPHRPRHRLPGHAQVPAGRLHRPDGRRADRGQLLDHPDPSQLGRVLPRPRLLPPLPQRDATEKHYVRVGRIATIGLFFSGAALVFVLETAKDSFDIILQVGAGTGLLYLVRWFWWRVNAWCEVNAMIRSFVVSIGLLILRKFGVVIPTHYALLLTIAVTTVSWLLTAYLGPQTDRSPLDRFLQEDPALRPGLEGRPARRRASPRPTPARRTRTSRWPSSAGSPGR